MTQSQQRALRELDLVLRRIKQSIRSYRVSRYPHAFVGGMERTIEMIEIRKREIRAEGKKP